MSGNRKLPSGSWSLWLLLGGLFGSSAVAQQVGPFFLPSIAITNYDRVLIGEQEALESGAFVARVGSITSGWYNPAGMLLVKDSTIGGSGSGYEADQIELAGLSKTGSTTLSIAQLPSYLGGVLGQDVLHSSVWRLGFSITKPSSWSQGIQGGTDATERTSYSTAVSFSTVVPMISVAVAPLPCFRLGIGVGVAVTQLSEEQTLSTQSLTTTSTSAVLRTLDGGGSVWNLTGNFGAQFDITEHLTVGATLRLPGLKVASSGSLTTQDVVSTGKQVFFKDLDASFDYKLPTEVDFGIGWQSKWFGFEADVRYHAAVTTYNLLASQNPVETVTTAPDGTPAVINTPFPGIQNGAKPVWNWAIGGNVSLGEWWSLHGGFFSDYSPVSSSSQAFFRAVNTYGVTIGARARSEHFSGSLGFGFNWGSSANFTLTDPATQVSVSTKLIIRNVQILYALTYEF